MIRCIAKETCFYGGKRYRKGEAVSFEGAAKDVPKYLEKPEKSKQSKPAEDLKPQEQ